METKQSIFSNAIIFWSLAVATACLSGCERKTGQPEALPKNNIVQAKRFWRFDNEQDVENHLSFKQGDGFYAVLELEALADCPEEVNGHQVTAPRLWPCVAICYPKGKTIQSQQAIRFEVPTLLGATGIEDFVPPMASKGPQTKSPNYKGPMLLDIKNQPKEFAEQQKKLAVDGARMISGGTPVSTLVASDKFEMVVLKHKFDEGIVPYWLFLGPTHAAAGEYTLEILTHPFYAGMSQSGSSPIGPPVVIYKGTIEITE